MARAKANSSAQAGDRQAAKPEAKPLWDEISPEEAGKPETYVLRSTALMNKLGRGEISPLDHQRAAQALNTECEDKTGVTIAQALQEKLDPLEKAKRLTLMSEPELLGLKAAFEKIDDLRLPPAEKKRLCSLIDLTVDLQRRARKDPVLHWTYVGRDAETGGLFDWQRFHLDFFEVWNDPDHNNSLIMAPVGHGKSYCLYGQATWEVADDTRLRCLYLLDTKAKAEETIRLVKFIMRSPRFRALYPEIRVLGRTDGAKDSSECFTVCRENEFSRDPTFQAAGIDSNLNGRGVDRIFADDFFPPASAPHEAERTRHNQAFFSVVLQRIRNAARGRVRIIHTPWNVGDTSCVIRRMIEEGRFKSWRLGMFPILDDDKNLAIPLWPSKHTRDYLELQKVTPGVAYDQCYRLQVGSRKRQLVHKVWWFNSVPNTFKGTDAKCWEIIEQSERWLSVDPAVTTNDQSCYSGVSEIRITPRGLCAVTDAWLLFLSPTDMRNWLANRMYFAPPPGYYGIQIESCSGMKGVSEMWRESIIQTLERGEVPVQNPDGTWKFVQMAPYKQTIQFDFTGAQYHGRGQNQSKEQRLIQTAPSIGAGIIRFAGIRKYNHTTKETYLGPIEGSDMHRLTEHIRGFGTDTSITDGVDSITQFLLYHAGRIKSWLMPSQTEEATMEDLDPLVASFHNMLKTGAQDESELDQEDAVMAKYSGRQLWN